VGPLPLDHGSPDAQPAHSAAVITYAPRSGRPARHLFRRFKLSAEKRTARSREDRVKTRRGERRFVRPSRLASCRTFVPGRPFANRNQIYRPKNIIFRYLSLCKAAFALTSHADAWGFGKCLDYSPTLYFCSLSCRYCCFGLANLRNIARSASPIGLDFQWNNRTSSATKFRHPPRPRNEADAFRSGDPATMARQNYHVARDGFQRLLRNRFGTGFISLHPHTDGMRHPILDQTPQLEPPIALK
jgi:hypothetical protein